MKVFLFMLIALSSYGQIVFEKGYFIDNSNQRTECLIKNIDWRNNPARFLFKMEGVDSVKEGTIATVKAFGVYGYSNYVRGDVKIDRTKSTISDLTYERNPAWSQEKLFLRVIVAAKASLYYYEEGNLSRFFYSISGSPIEQLIHKEYFVHDVDDAKSIMVNNDFRQQLLTQVKCKSDPTNTVSRIRYNRTELERYFRSFNICEGDSTMPVKSTAKRNVLNIKINPGFTYSSVVFSNLFSGSYFDFNKTINFRLGIEFEYFLPFNKNKWSIVFEPTLQFLNTAGPQMTQLTYNTIEFPLGLRYYVFLNGKSKIFLDGFYLSSASYNPGRSSVDLRYPPGNSIVTLDMKSNYSLAGGLGVEVGRLSAEARYYSSRDLLSGYIYWDSNYHRMSLLFGYKIFRP